MSSIKAKANPRLMTWARTSAGFSISEAAKKIGVKDEQIQAWESNEDKPTVVQLRKAAQVTEVYPIVKTKNWPQLRWRPGERDK